MSVSVQIHGRSAEDLEDILYRLSDALFVAGLNCDIFVEAADHKPILVSSNPPGLKSAVVLTVEELSPEEILEVSANIPEIVLSQGRFDYLNGKRVYAI